MTLDEAYAITEKMTKEEAVHPTPEMTEAKWLIYTRVTLPRSKREEEDIPPYMEPDYMDGWKNQY